MITSYPSKFVIDVGVGRTIEHWLISNNFIVFAIASINPEMEDIQILDLANKEDAIIITMDKDFGELVFKNFLPHKGILLLRLEDAISAEKLAVIETLIPYQILKIKNTFSVYQNGKFRIRK
jgi:predicted nuclease of predicted toxin-antitoxin system